MDGSDPAHACDQSGFQYIIAPTPHDVRPCATVTFKQQRRKIEKKILPTFGLGIHSAGLENLSCADGHRRRTSASSAQFG